MPEAHLIIRHATPSDAAALLGLYHVPFCLAVAELGGCDPPLRTNAGFRRGGSHPPSCLEAASQTTGLKQALDRETTFMMHEPDERTTTVAEWWARAVGQRRLELTVLVHNFAGVGLYRKMGFVIEGTRRDSLCVDGVFVDEYAMVKILE